MNRLLFFKPTLVQSWLLVAFFFVGSLIAGAVALFWKCISFSYLLSFLIVAFYVWRVSGKNKMLWEELKLIEYKPVGLNVPSFGRMGAPLFIALSIFGVLLLGVLVEPTVAFIPMPETLKAQFESILIGSPLWDSVLSTCILAPLLEECLCRGLMLRGMLAERSPKSAIVWSSLIFAVLHMNPWQSIPAFILGLFLGWCYYRSGSLWVPVLLHCVNNSLSVVLSRALKGFDVDDGFISLMPTGKYIIFYLISLLLFAVVIYLLKNNDEKTLSSEIHPVRQGDSLGQ